MSRSQKPPAYLLHKPSGQARVRVNGKDYYLGPHGSAESKDRYDDLIHKWRLQAVGDESHLVTVDDLALAYLEHAKGHYLKGGRETSEVCCIRNALRFLVAVAGRMQARAFGPKLLKEVRQWMIAEGQCRTTINKNMGRVRRAFRWGVAEELIPPTVLTALASVDGLRAGRCKAVESEPVRPVSQHAIEAIKPFVARPVWAMVQLQLITGMRSGEVVAMRAADLSTGGAIWEYRPRSHKTEHHGKQRLVFLGPRAQAIIKPFLIADTQAHLFDPTEARNGRGRKGRHYRRDSYRRAIERGCEHAFGMPADLRNPRRLLSHLPENERKPEYQRRLKAAVEWHHEHCWFPHQLRHNAATAVRREAGLETARCVLGHSSVAVSELYAEADLARARDIMAKLG
jgi:integrase